MKLGAIIDQVTTALGIPDSPQLRLKVKMATEEIWNTFDFPPMLREDKFLLNDSIAALPWFVYRIRAAKPCCSPFDIDLNAIQNHYADKYDYASPWRWRILGQRAISQPLTGEGQLKIQTSYGNSEEVVVTLTGENEASESFSERVVFQPGQLEASTAYPYRDIAKITKNKKTHSSFTVIDLGGNEVARIPNNRLQSFYTWVRIMEPDAMFEQCVYILYKLPPPELEYDDDEFPDPYGWLLVLKIMELLKALDRGEFEQAAALASKGAGLATNFTNDLLKGQLQAIRTKRNPFRLPRTL